MQVRRRRGAVAVERCRPPEKGCCCDEDHCFGFHCFGQLSRRRARHARPTRTALLALVGRCVVCAQPAAAAIASHAAYGAQRNCELEWRFGAWPSARDFVTVDERRAGRPRRRDVYGLASKAVFRPSLQALSFTVLFCLPPRTLSFFSISLFRELLSGSTGRAAAAPSEKTPRARRSTAACWSRAARRPPRGRRTA